MIAYTKGDIFRQNAEALVNPVNCVGIMGKGLALKFKIAYPSNFNQYLTACRNAAISPSRPLVHTRPAGSTPRYIINLATKRHWRDSSILSDLDKAIKALARTIALYQISSIAIPAIGSGLGGLNWEEVKPLIDRYLSDIPSTKVTVLNPW